MKIGDDLVLYPFRPGELAELPTTAGFTEVTMYADLVPLSEEEDERKDQIAKADFFTYVALRPDD